MVYSGRTELLVRPESLEKGERAMSDKMMTILPDGNLKISVDAQTQADVAHALTHYRRATALASARPTVRNTQRFYLAHEPRIWEILYGDTNSPCCNGWDTIRPEEIGALISEDCTILAEDVERDDMGNLVAIHGNGGAVFYDNDYAIRNPMRDIARDGYVIFERADPDPEDKGEEEEQDSEPDMTGNWMKDVLHADPAEEYYGPAFDDD